MNWLWIPIGIIAACAVIILIWYIVTYNSFIKLRNSIEEAFATIDVYLKQRFDLIPNIVETVKGYAAHEQDLLQKLTEARSRIAGSSTTQERLANENALSGMLRGLLAVAESYPDLKASINFLDLQKQLQQAEKDIANSRKYYNATVKMFNTKTETFPANLVALQFHFEKQPLFETSDERERENVNVQF